VHAAFEKEKKKISCMGVARADFRMHGRAVQNFWTSRFSILAKQRQTSPIIDEIHVHNSLTLE